MYANDNRGVLPIPGGRESDLTPVGLAICGVRLEEWGRLNFREGTLWPYLAADLNARQELFLCPSDEPPRFARNYILPEADPDRPRNFSYTFTNFMAEGLRLSRIRRAPQKILILEQDMPRAPLGFPFTGYTASNPGDPPGPPIIVFLTRRHLGKANEGFADGHVELIDPEIFNGDSPDMYKVKGWHLHVSVSAD
jgi:prepilin-type processing-associated H-X9-DG protein